MGSAARAHVGEGATPSRASRASGGSGTSGTGADATAVDGADGTGAAGAPGTAPGGPGAALLDRRIGDRTLALIVGAVTLPLLWMGYGTDIDVANVLDTVERIHDGDYRPSRTPGVPVFEGIAAALDPVGGHLLLNLATAAAAAATVVGIARLVRAWGHANGDLIALAFLASPITIVAASSVGDFIWALLFLVWGALVHLRAPTGSGLWPGRRRRGVSRSDLTDDEQGGERRSAGEGPERGADRTDRAPASPGGGIRGWARRRDPSLGAGVLFGLAGGSRLSTGFLVAAFLVADGWEPSHRRRCVRSALFSLPVAVLLYVPSWLSFDRSLAFLETSDSYRGFANNLGRFVYKNYAAAGPVLLVVLLVAVPALVAVLRRWKADPLVRFGVLAFVVSEVLYFQLPLKVAHLLPALLALLLWLAASRRNQRPFLWLVIGALAINGLVSFRLLAPDDAHDAREARWNPSVGAGLLVNDIDCRLEHMDEPPARYQDEAWDCALKPVRSPASG